jgi:diguanylate cyclase (GGDEF)-like protein/PAS domain S-box-containing protein
MTPGPDSALPALGPPGWRGLAWSTLLGTVVGLGCMLAAFAGAAAQPQAPMWAASALALGVAVAAVQRWGLQASVGGAAGFLLALAALELPAPRVLWVGSVLVLATLWASWLLARLRFDPRLERARDVAALAAVLAVGTALPAAALVVAGGPTGNGGLVQALLQGWVTLGLGSLLGVVPALSLERRLLQRMQDGQRIELGLSAAAVPALAALVWAGTGPWPALAPAAVLLPHVVVVALVLRGRIALASSAVLCCVLLGIGAAGAGLSLWGSGAGVHASTAAWVASLLAVLLMGRAAAAEAHGRSQRWEWALDGSRLGVADWVLPGDTGFASSAWRTLTGHTARDWSAPQWLARVHPEDRGAVETALETARSGVSGRQALELRLSRGGGWRWMEVTLLVVERSPGGRPTRLLATLADVQARHEALERQFMSVALFQHLHEGLLVTDADLRALDANGAYTQILGVPRDELLGSVPSLLRPTPADPVAREQRAAMWAGLRDQGHWRGELLERKRNGELRTLQATISAVRGPQDDLRYHVLVISDITDQREQREQLERQAHYDELTRLPNRTRLTQLLDEAMRAADRDGYLLVVCYLDLDRFKPVNDRFGHAAGDRLLAELAGRLRSALRSRKQWADAAARLGGDEFVLLLRAGTLEEARLALERVLRVVAQPYVIDPAQEPVHVTTSIGATIYPIDRSDADALLRHADHAMYGAKQTGRNRYTFFDPEHRRRTEERVMAIGRVQEALDQGEFVLFWQPQVDMTRGRVLGFEALLRWEHPQQGLIAPMQFLPLIENTGLGSRVGDWVLARALEYLAQWRRDGLDIKVSVNVSARHLQEPDFAQRLSELLARHAEEDLAPFLELEILETAAHADMEATGALLARCRTLGVRFALDDFGTGYSTLKYLQTLPVDTLKIDRSFVNHMLDDAQDRGIVEGVIGLARTFGYAIVAEGVESPAQARTLVELGCHVGQGTGVAAPMPAEQVGPWTREYRGMFALVPAGPTGPHVPTGAAGAPTSAAGGL